MHFASTTASGATVRFSNGCACGGCGSCNAKRASSMAGGRFGVRLAGFGAFGGTPPPSYVLDELFASLDPLRTRLSEVYAQAYTAWVPDNVKGAALSSLAQASNMLTRASIDGDLGQKLAMGDVTYSQWASSPENAADLVETVATQIGMAGVSIKRLWREVVVPTAETVGAGLAKIPGAVVSWGPVVAVGLVGLILLVKLK